MPSTSITALKRHTPGTTATYVAEFNASLKREQRSLTAKVNAGAPAFPGKGHRWAYKICRCCDRPINCRPVSAPIPMFISLCGRCAKHAETLPYAARSIPAIKKGHN